MRAREARKLKHFAFLQTIKVISFGYLEFPGIIQFSLNYPETIRISRNSGNFLQSGNTAWRWDVHRDCAFQWHGKKTVNLINIDTYTWSLRYPHLWKRTWKQRIARSLTRRPSAKAEVKPTPYGYWGVSSSTDMQAHGIQLLISLLRCRRILVREEAGSVVCLATSTIGTPTRNWHVHIADYALYPPLESSPAHSLSLSLSLSLSIPIPLLINTPATTSQWWLWNIPSIVGPQLQKFNI